MDATISSDMTEEAVQGLNYLFRGDLQRFSEGIAVSSLIGDWGPKCYPNVLK